MVAYALAGTMDIDLVSDPLGHDPDGAPVYLRDIWPTNEEVSNTMRAAINRGMFEHQYARLRWRSNWRNMPIPPAAFTSGTRSPLY